MSDTAQIQPLVPEPSRLDEPQQAKAYSDVLTQVASDGTPVIVRRDGQDLAAVVPLAYLELAREALAWQKVEEKAKQIDWSRVSKNPPPQSWYDDEEDNPFEPEAGDGSA